MCSSTHGCFKGDGLTQGTCKSGSVHILVRYYSREIVTVSYINCLHYALPWILKFSVYHIKFINWHGEVLNYSGVFKYYVIDKISIIG